MLYTLSSRDVPVLLIDSDRTTKYPISVEYDQFHRWLYTRISYTLTEVPQFFNTEQIDSYGLEDIVIRSLIIRPENSHSRYVTYLFIQPTSRTSIRDLGSKLSNVIIRSRNKHLEIIGRQEIRLGEVPLLYGLSGPLVRPDKIQERDRQLLFNVKTTVDMTGRMALYGPDNTILLETSISQPQEVTLTNLDELHLDIKPEYIPYDYVWYQGTDVLSSHHAEYLQAIVEPDRQRIRYNQNIYDVTLFTDDHIVLKSTTSDIPDIELRRTVDALYSIATAMVPLAWNKEARQELNDYINDSSTEPPPEVTEKYRQIVDQLEEMTQSAGVLSYNMAEEFINRYGNNEWDEVRLLLF